MTQDNGMTLESSMTLTPAYGRDYKSKKAALEAYRRGDDFILNDPTSPWDGKPCSIRDFPDKQVSIRYNNLWSVIVVDPEAKK